jgi:hypothetical protein
MLFNIIDMNKKMLLYVWCIRVYNNTVPEM